MAFSVSREIVVFGNKRVALISATADATSGNVDTGLSVIDHVCFAPGSGTAGGAVTFRKNIGSGATSRPGILNLQDSVSGDVYFLTVYGR